MKSLIILSAVLLSGCFGTVPTVPDSVVIKYKYVVNTIPNNFLEIPKTVPNIDTRVATDKEAAEWILDKEGRVLEIEKKLKSIKTYQDDKLKEIETQLKIPKEDIIIR